MASSSEYFTPLAAACGGAAAAVLCLKAQGGGAASDAPPAFEGPPDSPVGPTTLTYWNGRGLAESIRFMLAVCGEDYAERVPTCHPSVTHLAEPAQLVDLRNEGFLVWNQVPLLVIDGLHLTQSQACVRYLARKHGLCGACDADSTRCDIVAEGINDWKSMMGRGFEFSFGAFDPSPEQLQKTEAANAKYFPLFERLLKRALDSAKPAYMMSYIGLELTYCDIMLFEGLEQVLPRCPGCTDAFPLLKALHAHLRTLPKLAAFLASDMRKNKDASTVPGYKASVNKTLAR